MRFSVGNAIRGLKNRLVGRNGEMPARPEIALISFPKCGRTWLRMLLGRTVANQLGIPRDQSIALSLSFAKLAELSPELPLIRPRHDDVPHWRRPEELAVSKEKFRDSSVIFLVRDPRDVIVSLYFELSKRLPKYIDEELVVVPEDVRQRVKPFGGTMEEFVAQDVGGFETIVRYFNIWAANRQVPKAFLLMRYEDLYSDTRTELNRLLDFIGMKNIPEECISEAIEFAQFDNMQKLEASGKAQASALTAGGGDRESFKTRRGVVGGFRDYLSPEQVERMSQIMFRDLSSYFGYTVEDHANSGRE